MKKRKFYEKPSMKVYPLRQKPKLLVGSLTSTNASFDDYQDGEFTW